MKAKDLDINEKIKILKGNGNWHTNDLDGKIRPIHLADGPHGLRAQEDNAASNNDSIISTCFPTASATACSFDTELIGEVADAISKETREANVSILLGPGVNMKRSPLCGRNFEYFSEDPYLAGEMGSAYVKAVQKNGIGTSLKHFAANSQETNRMTSNSIIDERTLREIYLRAFEKVVKDARPATIMASYNFVNGESACANSHLLTDILRDEWGYEGLVMSDWGACVKPGECIHAGMDLEMPDSHGNHDKDILSALEDGTLSEAELDRAVDRILDMIKAYPRSFEGGLRNISDETLDAHLKLAVRASEECAVLLKNNGILPLCKPEKVILIGELAEKMRIQGGGSSHIHTREIENIISVFKDSGIETVYFRGYDSDSKNTDICTGVDKSLCTDAVNGLKKALESNPDLPVIVFGGLTDKAEGEGYDRIRYDLPANQRALFNEIKKVTENIIYVSFGGSPYDVSDVSFVGAILSMYLGGEGVAKACVNLLLGNANPSGRLAETWPLKVEDTPCYEAFGRQNKTPFDVKYKEGLFIGYRYYDTFKVPVSFPFGHGLSYTTFDYSNLKVINDNKKITVSVDVTNTGNMEGRETVLVFVKNNSRDIIRPVRELRGFDKVSLQPGETKTVNIKLDDRSFDIYDVNKKAYVTAGGEYDIEISKSVGDIIIKTTLLIDGEDLRGVPGKYSSYFYSGANNKLFSEEDFTDILGKKIRSLTDIKPGEFTMKNSLMQMSPYSAGARMLMIIGKIAAVVMTKKSLSDPETRMMYEGITEGNIDSVCNQSGGIISYRMIEGIVKSANKKRDRNGD